MSEEIRRFNRYLKYKNSGVEWLGEIPAHWVVAPVYARYEVALGKMLDAKRMTGTAPEPYLRNIDVQWDRVNVQDLPAMDFEPAEEGRYSLRPGDLLICEGGEVGRTAIWNGELAKCYYQKAIHRVRPRTGAEWPRFFYYVMRAAAESGVFSGSGNLNTIDHLTATQLRHYRFAFAGSREQVAIASFLDRETARIDALVAKKERLIELLQEIRSAFISRAVSVGLVPGTPLKPSGVEWLAAIPAHWEVKRLGDIAASLQTGPFGSQLHADEYVQGAIPVVNPANLRDGKLLPDDSATVDESTARRLGHHRLIADDILFARWGELGRCGLVTRQQEGWLCGTGSLRLRVLGHIASPQYIMRLLSTSGVRDWLQLQSVGSTMQNLNTSIISRIPIALPGHEEQDAIATEISHHAMRIDALVASIRDAIATLQELRTALISAAVTGKIDVREDVA